MYFCSSTRRRFPLQFDLIVINGGTDEIFRARSLIVSPSKKSIARHALPSRPALKGLSGSGWLAPWEKVSLPFSLWALSNAFIPSFYHSGLPIHFHSSLNSLSVPRLLSQLNTD